MQENYVLSCVKRANRNSLVFSVILVFILLIVGVMSGKYLYNVLLGPFDTNSQALLSIKDPNALNKYYVTLKCDDVYDTGLSDIKQKINKATNKVTETIYEKDYIMLLIEGRTIIAKVPHGKQIVGNITGKLTTLPVDTMNEIVDIAVEQGIPEEGFRQMLIPVMLEVNDFKTGGYVIIVISSILLLILIFSLKGFISSSNDPYKHSTYKSLGKYGVVEEIEEQINSEFESSKKSISRKLTFAETWFTINHSFSTSFIKIDQVIWVYKKVTKQSVNFIPTGKTYELALYLQDKTYMMIAMKQKFVDEAIDKFCEKAPWIITGYTNEIHAIWKKQFSEFLAQVEERKKTGEKTEEKTESTQQNNDSYIEQE